MLARQLRRRKGQRSRFLVTELDEGSEYEQADESVGRPRCGCVLRPCRGRRLGGRRPAVIQQLARARRGTGNTDASGLTHRGVAFFPAIFTGGDVAAYKSNPSLLVYCPNATDKTLL